MLLVRVKLFAALAQRSGRSELPVEVPPGATVGELRGAVARADPSLEPMLKSVLVAVNHDFAPAEQVLRPDDEVALIPPVSGGDATLYELVDEPISVERVVARVANPNAGAVVVFLGIVREFTGGRQTRDIEYHAYREMAKKKLAEIGAQVALRWPEARLAITHRLGRLGIGEISVVIAVATPHRPEAFEAARFAIDTLKEIVPIWKKEISTDGEVWV